MRQSPAESQPLVEMITSLVHDFDEHTGLQSDFEHTGSPIELSAFAEQTPFRTVQESLTNIQKHAKGVKHIQVKLEYSTEAIRLVVSDDGQLITWVFIPLIAISAMFAYERQKGTLWRLLTTPTRQSTYLLGTLFGQVVTALVQMLLLIAFGILVMKLNWGQNLPGLAVMLVTGALAAAALGTTLGTFVKTEGQASGLSIMIGMVMALLGGCWYPLEMFPQAVQNIVKILPTTWAMRGLLDIVLRGQGLTAILPEAGTLIGFAAVFFGIGIWRFKYELGEGERS